MNKKEMKILKDFNHTVKMMKTTLLNNYDNKLTELICSEIVLEYKKIIPEIPHFKGYRQKMFNDMLIITSQILAAYRVLIKYDKTPDEIWEICYEALCLKLQKIPLWKRSLMKQFWHIIFGKILKNRGKRNVKETLGNFKLEYLDGDGVDYDFGINYSKCGHHVFLKKQNAEEIFPYVCLSDIALSNALGWGLIRTQTIADGCDYCDFRFKKGGITKISSKTPKVQEMINRIETRNNSIHSYPV